MKCIVFFLFLSATYTMLPENDNMILMHGFFNYEIHIFLLISF